VGVRKKAIKGGSQMTKLPKLKVEGLGWDVSKEVCDFEQAKYFPFGKGVVIVAEGQVIESYDDLVQLVDQDRYKDKEFLEVMFLPIIVGG